MSVITVYRVELSDGRGPYRTARLDFDRQWDMLLAHNDVEHPSPQEDSLPLWGHHFAFPSVEALEEWFGGWLWWLLDEGANIFEIELPAPALVGVTGKQVCYPEDTTPLRKEIYL